MNLIGREQDGVAGTQEVRLIVEHKHESSTDHEHNLGVRMFVDFIVPVTCLDVADVRAGACGEIGEMTRTQIRHEFWHPIKDQPKKFVARGG